MRELSILEAARESPEQDCLITSTQTLSYADVATFAEAAIASLVSQGVRPGDRVAFSPGADVESIVRLLALFELGCPAVLLHPRLTEYERIAILKQAAPTHTFEGVLFSDVHHDPTPMRPVPPNRALAIVFSSGSAGRARGALLSRRAFVASYRAHTDNLGWAPSDRWLLAIPPAHVGGLSIITRCLIARSAVVLDPGPFEPSRTLAVLGPQRVTLLSLVPTMLRRLLDSTDPPWSPTSSLRAVLVGGAPFVRPLRERAASRAIPVIATYGCTEACSQIATQELRESGQPGCGAPLSGIEVRIHDGEIHVRGPTMMDRYLAPEDNVGAWTEDGWFRTRDAGSLGRAGELFVTGRLDEIIVTGGENVAPAEVQAVLESVPGVLGACVFAVPHEAWGQEVAAAVVVGEAPVDRDSLRAALSAELASFKRPKRIAWVDSLPLNRSGKVDRHRVREQFEAALEAL